MTRWHRWPLVLAAVAPLAAAVAQQGTGTVSGQVTDASTGQPLPAAQVQVVGTNLGAATNDAGQYTIRNVPAREVRLRVLRVGFGEGTQAATVTAGGTATVNIALRPVSVTLTPVITTATGEARRVELGNAIPTINAAELVQTAPVTNMGDLLTARAPGVTVLPSNISGTAPRVRIRGTSSLSLTNNPIYVIDGVRMTSTTLTLGTGGAQSSSVTDINPEEIENIEIVKGPSAATLYGTSAANGVIVITTKKGRSGKTQWNAYAEGGLIQQRNDFPTAYAGWGKTRTGATTTTCTLISQGSGACTLDSLSSFNLFDDPATTPFANGSREQYGLQVSGGSEAVRFFSSGEWEGETGTFKLPGFADSVLRARNGYVLDEWRRPNGMNRGSGRLNLNAAPTSKLDLGLQTSFTHLNNRYPQADNNTFGLFSSAYGGPGYRYQTSATDLSAGGVPRNGYRLLTPAESFTAQTDKTTNRFIGALNSNWRPTTWLSGRLNAGLDYSGMVLTDLCRFADCPGSATRILGFADDNRFNLYNYTFDGAAAATWNPRPSINSKTTVGAQYVYGRTDQNAASGTELPPGALTVSGAVTPSVSSSTSLSKTLGLFIEEQVGFRDRLFLTGAVRTDQNNAFGTNFQSVYYPKASVSWIISDESFFPKAGWLNQLRLRSAYGASGVQPNATDAITYFSPTLTNVERSERAGLVQGAIGNPDLRPERSTETEAGFESRLFGSRVSLDLTYYSKQTKDALISRVIAPSAGAPTRTIRQNVGSVKNAGFEALVTAQLVDRRPFTWNVTLNGSTYANKLVSLGDVPPQIGSNIYQVPGYPLNGWWDNRYTFNDANGDHIISTDEVTLSDSAEFLGYSTPRHEVVLTNSFELFNRRLRVQALVDYKGGYLIENVTQEFRCTSRNNCRELYDKTTPLEDQAAVVSIRQFNENYGYYQDGSFIRFRELSATLMPPARFARALRANSTSLTFSARNLGFFKKKYKGIDPEMNYGTGDVQNEFQTTPTPTLFSLRLNVGF